MGSESAELEIVPLEGGGARLRLRVKPGARRTAIVGVHGGALKVAVSAPPERGKANDAVVALLADALRLPASAIAIVSGETGRDKVVRLPLEASAVRARLAASLEGSGAV